ncbi:hypothetical protein Leryth_024958 [Lithospermum erythrorhizon]|nr:hypothetical protein Leryth_024958 [Lithospermum erythrorhizon]
MHELGEYQREMKADICGSALFVHQYNLTQNRFLDLQLDMAECYQQQGQHVEILRKSYPFLALMNVLFELDKLVGDIPHQDLMAQRSHSIMKPSNLLRPHNVEGICSVVLSSFMNS